MNLYCGLTGGLYCHAFVHAYNCIINLRVQAQFYKYVQLTFHCFCKNCMRYGKNVLKQHWQVFVVEFSIKHCCAFMFIL